MKSNMPNIELEQKIDAYIKGHLTEAEAQKLWVELLKHPEYIDQLQAEIDLTRYHSQIQNQSHSYQHYWKWISAAAAVFLIVVGINLFSNNTLSDYSLDSIFLGNNLATNKVARSDSSGLEDVDSLLNLGFDEAINGNTDEAITIYNKVIAKYPGSFSAAKASLNIGILTYNKGAYTESIENLKKVLSNAKSDDFISEQAYWYLANALINIEKVEEAEKALQSAYHLNGVHRSHAMWLLEKLDEAEL